MGTVDYDESAFITLNTSKIAHRFKVMNKNNFCKKQCPEMWATVDISVSRVRLTNAIALIF